MDEDHAIPGQFVSFLICSKSGEEIVMNKFQEILFKSPQGPIVVVITRTRWEEPPRIRHQLTRQLARFYNVLFIERPLPDEKMIHEPIIKIISDRLIVCNLPNPEPVGKRFYANIPFIHARHDRAYAKTVETFIRGFTSEKCILINFEYDFVEIMESAIFDYKVYVCYDEFPRMRRKQKEEYRLKAIYQGKLFQAFENIVAQDADLCLAIHQPLYEKLIKVNKNTILFYPGHESQIKKMVFKKESRIKKIKIAFMGYITYNLFFDWLIILQKQNWASVYLIGPLHKIDLKKLSQMLPKAIYHSALTGDGLMKKLMEMDILIMPYNTNIPEVKAVTVPNKLFQYIAAGKPVVISDMPNFITMPNGIIYRARTAEEFVGKIRQAYEEDCQEFYNLRIKIAAENTWDARGNELYQRIQSDLLKNTPNETL